MIFNGYYGSVCKEYLDLVRNLEDGQDENDFCRWCNLIINLLKMIDILQHSTLDYY